MKKRSWAIRVPMFIIFGIAAVTVLSFVVMSLWNAILVPAVHVSVINFWQAAGIFLLSKLLFGGRWAGHGWRGGGGGWRRDMREKWQNMTPEEREQAKSQWRERCHRWGRKQDAAVNTVNE